MTDRKFTEDELVELLRAYVERMCGKCNVKDLGKCCNSCFLLPISQSADLIERQKEEIETWKKNCDDLYEEMSERQKAEVEIAKRMGKSKAIKEFAERLKHIIGFDDLIPTDCVMLFPYIDNLVTEMTEEAKHD